MCHAYAEPNQVIDHYQKHLVQQIAIDIAERHGAVMAGERIPTPKEVADEYLRWAYITEVNISGSSIIANLLKAELAAMGFRMGGFFVNPKENICGFHYDLVYQHKVVEESFV